MTSAQTAGLAFDVLAPTYDADFTHTHIGKAQRDVVLSSAFATFAGRQRLLEMNCGTGEDASRLAAAGWNVLALDASKEMINIATRRLTALQANGSLTFRHLATEDIDLLDATFDGIFSNFSGLNCVFDLKSIAENLAALTTPGSPLIFCFSTRFCLWEILWYALTLQPGKAVRRWRGTTRTTLRGRPLTVHYPLLRAVKAAFAPHFRLESVRAVGLFVPPSYLERYVAHTTVLLRGLVALDSVLSRLPFFRIIGDHMLLTLRKEEDLSR